MIASARSSTPVAPPSKKTGGVRYRLAVASRALAAIAGGYALAAGTNVALALALKNTGPKEDVIMLATMPAFLVWAGAVVWVFAARTAWRAWAGVAVPCVIVALVIWWLRSGGAAS
jgi:drug/metabolite transporter (DMT)-like permease